MKNILKIADVEGQKKGEERQVFIRRVVAAINSLTDTEFEELDGKAKDWFNSVCDVLDANKAKGKSADLPDFPDAEQPAKEETGGRRRRSAEDEEAPETVVGVGTFVTVVTKRGREYKGEVVEYEKDKVIVVKDDKGDETEIDWDKVGTVEVKNGGTAKDDGPAEPAGPQVGDEVSLKTKRGRDVTGVVVSVDEEEIVLTTSEGPEEFLVSRIDSLKVTKAGGGDAPATAETSSRRRGADAPAAGAAPADGAKPPRTVNKDGVSVGQSIKEILAKDPDATMEAVMKALTKADVLFKEVTVKMNYEDLQKFIKALREAKRLK